MKKIQQQEVSYDQTVPSRVVKTTHVVDGMQEETPHEYQKKRTIYRTYQIIWYLLGVVETLLGFRVLLKLMAANPVNPFTSFIYDISYLLAYPFLGIVSTSVVPTGSVFEWSTIIGMGVYAVLAYALVYLFQLIKPASPEEVEEVVQNP